MSLHRILDSIKFRETQGPPHAGHLGAKGFDDLDRQGAQPTRSAINQYFMAGTNLSVISQPLQGNDGHLGDRSCNIEGDVGWFRHQDVFGNGDIFSKRAHPTVANVNKNGLARRELCDVGSNRFNDPRYIPAEDAMLWLEQPKPLRTFPLNAGYL